MHGWAPAVHARQAWVEAVPQRSELGDDVPPLASEGVGVAVEPVEAVQERVALRVEPHPGRAGDPAGHAHEPNVHVVGPTAPGANGHRASSQVDDRRAGPRPRRLAG